MRRRRGFRVAHPSRVLALASRQCELPVQPSAMEWGEFLRAASQKCVSAGRRNQHPGRARYPEPAAAPPFRTTF